MGDTTALAAGSVGEFNLLDLTNRRLEVFLSRGVVVSVMRFELSIRGRADSTFQDPGGHRGAVVPWTWDNQEQRAEQ